MPAQRIGCLLTVALLLASGTGAAADAGRVASLDAVAFLEGSWHSGGESSESEEHWLPPKGGLMLGLNRTVRDSGETSFEYLRIEQRDDGVFLMASPQGRAATPFKLVESSPGRVVFENPEHDFPQRIIYELLSENTLKARVEAEVDGETRGGEWRWIRGSR